MPRIALISTKECSDYCYDCSSHVMIDSISDWDEVTEQELKMLQRYCPSRIIVRDDIKPALDKVRKAVERAELEAVRKAVERAELEAKRHAETEEAKRKKREEKKRQKEMLANQKSEAEAKRLYEQLRAKFENKMF